MLEVESSPAHSFFSLPEFVGPILRQMANYSDEPPQAGISRVGEKENLMSDKLNLIDTLAKERKWSTFSRILDQSGTNARFRSNGVFTVFAPTNDAFAKISKSTMNGLLEEPGQIALRALL